MATNRVLDLGDMTFEIEVKTLRAPRTVDLAGNCSCCCCCCCCG